MKTSIVLLIFVLFIGTFFLIDSEALTHQAAPREDPSLPQVSLQLQLRNSEGQLVTYLEPTTMYITNIAMVHEYLDNIENKTIIEKDGENFELIEFQSTAVFSKTKQIATYGMVHKGIHVLMFRHDGYLTSPGDTLDVSWKIIRTLQ